MLYEIFVKEEETIDFSLTGMLFFAIGVSIDAFSTGLGLTAITNNLFLAMLIKVGTIVRQGGHIFEENSIHWKICQQNTRSICQFLWCSTFNTNWSFPFIKMK